MPLWSYKVATYLWDWWTPYWPCLDRERVGRVGDGGKWVCGMQQMQRMAQCVVYSYGINEDVSFEIELLERTKCKTLESNCVSYISYIYLLQVRCSDLTPPFLTYQQQQNI